MLEPPFSANAQNESAKILVLQTCSMNHPKSKPLSRVQFFDTVAATSQMAELPRRCSSGPNMEFMG